MQALLDRKDATTKVEIMIKICILLVKLGQDLLDCRDKGLAHADHEGMQVIVVVELGHERLDMNGRLTVVHLVVIRLFTVLEMKRKGLAGLLGVELRKRKAANDKNNAMSLRYAKQERPA